jgi:hypothetical protein
MCHLTLLPDGQPYPNTVCLSQVIDHPSIAEGDYTH